MNGVILVKNLNHPIRMLCSLVHLDGRSCASTYRTFLSKWTRSKIDPCFVTFLVLLTEPVTILRDFGGKIWNLEDVFLDACTIMSKKLDTWRITCVQVICIWNGGNFGGLHSWRLTPLTYLDYRNEGYIWFILSILMLGWVPIYTNNIT